MKFVRCHRYYIEFEKTPGSKDTHFYTGVVTSEDSYSVNIMLDMTDNPKWNIRDVIMFSRSGITNFKLMPDIDIIGELK